MCVRARWYKSQPENIIQIDHTDHTEKQNTIQSLADHTDSTLGHIKVCAKINHSDATLAKVCEQDLSRSCRMHPGKRKRVRVPEQVLSRYSLQGNTSIHVRQK